VYRAAVAAGFYTDKCSGPFVHRRAEADLRRLLQRPVQPAA
jgi:hypothetical protein